MIKLKMPFKYGIIHIEKELDFVFKIGTLEDATEEILKCDLFEADSQNPYDVNVAILYSAYLIGCQKKYKKPKYKLEHATFWMEHMSRESQTLFLKAVQELLGKMSGKGEKKK